MTSSQTHSKTLAELLARTPSDDIIDPPQWQTLCETIEDIAAASGGLVVISAKSGSGRTTFLSILATRASKNSDVIRLAPATPVNTTGWLMDAISPWLSSDTSEIYTVQKKLASLSDDGRPLLICVDGADFIPPAILARDIFSFLNLCDNCSLKATIVVAAHPRHCAEISREFESPGKLTIQRQLPLLTTGQLLQLLINRTKNISVSSLRPSVTALDEIASQSFGSPTTAILKLARRMGITSEEIPSESKHVREADTGGTSPGNSRDAEIVNLEELLPKPIRKKAR